MIGTAFAAIAYGMIADARPRQRASTRATAIPAEQPIRNPPTASLNVYQPALPSRRSPATGVAMTLTDPPPPPRIGGLAGVPRCRAGPRAAASRARRSGAL